MIIHSNLSKMKNKFLPTCLQGNNRDSLGEFSNTSHGELGAGRVTVSHKIQDKNWDNNIYEDLCEERSCKTKIS